MHSNRYTLIFAMAITIVLAFFLSLADSSLKEKYEKNVEVDIRKNILISLGFIDTSINFIAMDIALYTGLTYAYILLMIFPLYNAIESLDTNQLEAAKDLGSSTIRTHWRIVIPHAKAGIASGCTMVFMLTAGALATPVVLSSPNTYWFTQLIYQWFNMNDNWSRGSAYSIILLIVSVIFVLTMMRIFKVRIGEIIK